MKSLKLKSIELLEGREDKRMNRYIENRNLGIEIPV